MDSLCGQLLGLLLERLHHHGLDVFSPDLQLFNSFFEWVRFMKVNGDRPKLYREWFDRQRIFWTVWATREHLFLCSTMVPLCVDARMLLFDGDVRALVCQHQQELVGSVVLHLK
jgi:hypothetical protein